MEVTVHDARRLPASRPAAETLMAAAAALPSAPIAPCMADGRLFRTTSGISLSIFKAGADEASSSSGL